MWNQENVVAVVMYCKEDRMEDPCSGQAADSRLSKHGLGSKQVHY